MKTEIVEISELKQDPGNVRKHDKRNVEAIAESLKEFGHDA